MMFVVLDIGKTINMRPFSFCCCKMACQLKPSILRWNESTRIVQAKSHLHPSSSGVAGALATHKLEIFENGIFARIKYTIIHLDFPRMSIWSHGQNLTPFKTTDWSTLRPIQRCHVVERPE